MLGLKIDSNLKQTAFGFKNTMINLDSTKSVCKAEVLAHIKDQGGDAKAQLKQVESVILKQIQSNQAIP